MRKEKDGLRTFFNPESERDLGTSNRQTWRRNESGKRVKKTEENNILSFLTSRE